MRLGSYVGYAELPESKPMHLNQIQVSVQTGERCHRKRQRHIDHSLVAHLKVPIEPSPGLYERRGPNLWVRFSCLQVTDLDCSDMVPVESVYDFPARQLSTASGTTSTCASCVKDHSKRDVAPRKSPPSLSCRTQLRCSSRSPGSGESCAPRACPCPKAAPFAYLRCGDIEFLGPQRPDMKLTLSCQRHPSVGTQGSSCGSNT